MEAKGSPGVAVELALLLMVVTCLATLLASRKDDGWATLQLRPEMAHGVNESMCDAG